MTLEGQIAVVTGATGGVGGAITARLLAASVTTCLIGRSAEQLDELCQERGWNRVECYTADLEDEADLDRAADAIRRLHPALHFLVHAAGSIALGPVSESRLQDLDRQYLVNVRAPYQLTRALIPPLVAGQGHVVFVNSSAGVSAREGVGQYAATKHALRAVADSVRAEINSKGVRVLSVFLGRTASRMQAAVHAHEGKSYRPERLLQPDDVASIVMSALELPRTAEVTDLHVRPMLKS